MNNQAIEQLVLAGHKWLTITIETLQMIEWHNISKMTQMLITTSITKRIFIRESKNKVIPEDSNKRGTVVSSPCWSPK